MAKTVTLKRIITYGWISFRRNGWLSTATILVMMLTLFVIGGLLLTSVVANTILRDLEGKIDISMSFKKGTTETVIAGVKSEIQTLPEVREVTYVSAQEALSNFKERHKDDSTILASLEELGEENPLLATLNIKAEDPLQFASIADFLQKKNYPNVEKINYFENQKIIDRLSSVVRGVRSLGIAIVLILGFVAVLVAFNTVRLAIYTAREEINIMKLVGATNWYIRGPFMVEGVLHGVFAAIATSLLYFPIIWVASPKLLFFLPNINLQTYFTENFVQFLVILLTIGIVLGVGSSLLAVRRYLKI